MQRPSVWLGAAGTGKSFELEQVVELLRKNNISFEHSTFVDVCNDLSGESLAKGLERISKCDTQLILLDALDEAMVPIQRVAKIVKNWVEDFASRSNPRIVITCRPGVWPTEVEDALRKIFHDDLVVANILPLSRSHQIEILGNRNLNDPKLFWNQIDKYGLDLFCESPMMLKLLLDQFLDGVEFSNSRFKIFEQAVKHLIEPPLDRLKNETSETISTSTLLNAAEHLACFFVTSNIKGFSIGDEHLEGFVSHRSLTELELEFGKLDFKILRSLSRLGLFVNGANETFSFAHRLYMEFLAGRRISQLSFHQARSLLESIAGHQMGVAGPLRETAVFAAAYSNDIACWIAETDPELIAMSDVATDEMRKNAAHAIFELSSKATIVDSDFYNGKINIDGLMFEGASAFVRAKLDSRNALSIDEYECLFSMIERWNLDELLEIMADIFSDKAVPLEARKSAGYLLAKKRKPEINLKILPFTTDESDDSQDLKGIALQCNWPDNISSRSVISCLTNRKNNFYGGSYQSFLWKLYSEGFDASDCPVTGLRWARRIFEQRISKL